MRRHSGARQRAREKTGGGGGGCGVDVVCLGDAVVGCSWVRVGKSAANSFEGEQGRMVGLGVDTLEEIPWIIR